MTKRLLVIEKLVVAIPDDFAGTDHPDRPEITINDALRFLLDYRESQNAVIENRFGNFEYTSMDFPADTMPEGKGSENFTKETLLKYLADHPEKNVAGAMYSLIYDTELAGYRNCCRGSEQMEFEQRKDYLMAYYAKHAASETSASDEPSEHQPCEGCECICDENCPNDSRTAED